MTDYKPIVPQPFFGEIVRSIVRFLFRLLGGLTIIGAENVPAVGPVLVCPNHLSDCDPLAVYAALTRRDVIFVAKHELFELPVIGPGMRAFRAIPIHRESADRAAIVSAVGTLARGSVLVIFPEGHLAQDGHLQKLLPGMALIARRAQLELAKREDGPLAIVPVGLTRTNRFLPFGAAMLKRSRLPARVEFGRPIYLDGSDVVRQSSGIMAAVEQELRRLTRQ